MAYDYDKLYGETPDALGLPMPVIVSFFEDLKQLHLRVLDVGCGQGRDALFIARLGHAVVAVDASPNGIRALDEAATASGLRIEAVVADIRSYTPDGLFDVVLIDRTLHMLTRDDRLSTLQTLLAHVAPGGWIVIADEASNIPDFAKLLTLDDSAWETTKQARGYLFARKI